DDRLAAASESRGFPEGNPGMELAHAAVNRTDRNCLGDDRFPVGAPSQLDAARVELTVGDGFGDHQARYLPGKYLVSLVVIDAQAPDLLDRAHVDHSLDRLGARLLPGREPSPLEPGDFLAEAAGVCLGAVLGEG